MRIRPGRGLALLVLCCSACFGSAAPPPAAVSSPEMSSEEVAAFSARIETFYGALVDVPLDALVTYENKTLRDCFESPGAFSDYFSALATEARNEYFRDVAARSVRVREFYFDGPDHAGVEVSFRSVHERVLRFWTIGFDRHDTWERTDGVWHLVPEKL